MAKIRSAETAKCLRSAQENRDYLAHLPRDDLTKIMTYVYKDEHTFVRRAVDKNPSQSGFAKREHCQLLLTCKTLYFTAKPMFYGLTEFFFSTTESFDKFFAMDTVAGAERCLWTRNVVCENVQLHPILYEKESMLGVDVEDVVVIREDMDEYYEADCEDNF